MRGHVVAPTVPTCGEKVYDYFVVSIGLKYSVVGVAVIDDAGFYLHMPVRPRVWVGSRKPPAIPQGCVRECGEA